MADNNFRSDRGRDLIAELARRIVQAHPDVESAPAESGCRGETARDSYGVPPELPLASQLQVYGDAPEQTSELDEHHDDGAYDVDDQHCADDEHQDEVTRGRRPKLVVAMAMFSLALAGTAGAFGYHAMISSARLPMLPPIINAGNQPTKIAPAANEQHAKSAANTSQVDTVTTGSIEKLVSREEQPVTIVPPKPTSRVISTIPITTRQDSLTRGGPPAAPAPAATQAVPSQGMSGRVAAAADPTPQSGGQSSAGDTTAEVSPPVSGGGYAVQVTSERSESGAQAAFRALQAKYASQLSGREPIIRRADLGAAGIYYRALVGPFASAEKAAKLCSGLKAAGGNCIIQKN
jgi:SPOR domain